MFTPEKISKIVDSWNLDINVPYSAICYLNDLRSLVESPEQVASSITMTNPEDGHKHILQVRSNHLYLRIYNRLFDRYGDELGGGRALRSCALIAFYNRCRAKLDANGLNWLDAHRGSPERKLDFLEFILSYPVPREKQFHPEAIPESVIDEFMEKEAKDEV